MTVQELRALLSHVEIFNGFANRFLWWCVRRSKFVPLARGIASEDVERLGVEYARRLSIARDFDEVEFADDAREMYASLYPEMTKEEPGLFGVVTARAEAQIIRLALTYALLDTSQIIKVEHLSAAFAAWDYCAASARMLFGDAGGDPLEARILAAFETGPKTMTELHRAFSGHARAHELRATLERMEARGRIECRETSTAGRPGTAWHLRNEAQAKKANLAN